MPYIGQVLYQHLLPHPPEKMAPKKKALQSPKSAQPTSGQLTQLTALDGNVPVHRFFHLVNYRSWNQIDMFHKYRNPSNSAENHAKVYKSDLERISGDSSIPASLRKAASGLVKNFKNDEFVTRFAELTDLLAEKNANQAVRNIFFESCREPRDWGWYEMKT
jgi:uncharacterized protein (UPF0147 family)